mmetsp:Transcript_10946/g.20102  ORF Transcript_10946/g.20102 Transcript_10946/m.20102 type:complete len:343 (+) Transcript_10946:116-1144(+)
MGSVPAKIRRKIPTLQRGSSGLRLSRFSLSSKCYVLFATCQVLYLIFLCIVILVDQASKLASSFAIAWILCALALLYFVIDGVRREDKFVLWASVSTHTAATGFLVYSAFDEAIRKSMGPKFEGLSLASGIEMSVMEVVLLVSAWQTQKTFGFFVFNRVGANPRLQKLYTTYRIFVSLLKLDFVISLIVCILASLLEDDVVSLALTLIAAGISLAMMIVGLYGVREEQREVVCMFWVFKLFMPGYIAYKLYDLRDDPVFDVLLASGAVSVILRLVLMVYTCKVTYGFGQGLRDEVFIPDVLNTSEGKTIDPGSGWASSPIKSAGCDNEGWISASDESFIAEG